LEVGEAGGDPVFGVDEGVGVVVQAFEALVPELGFDDGEAFEEPGAGDEAGDEDVLFGGGGLEAVEVGLGEELVVGGVFGGDDGGAGEDAVVEGVEAGLGFAGGGAGAGGFEGVAAIARV
jgi:hypothetical protein